jgi:hypothetical protein
VVGVLVLVDEDVAERGGVALAHLPEQLQQVDGAQQEVIEVHRVHPQQVALVQPIDLGDHFLELRADLLPVGFGVQQAVLGGGDLVVDRGGGVALGVHPDLVHAALGQAPRVGLVVDRELARVAQAGGLGAQDPRAGGVEGHQPHPTRGATQQAFDPRAHLLGGLVGEGDGEDLAGLRLVGVDQERQPVGQHARLAAAGAGEDQQRALAVRDRLALGLVETLQQLLQVLGVGVRGHPVQHRCGLGWRDVVRRPRRARVRGGYKTPPRARRALLANTPRATGRRVQAARVRRAAVAAGVPSSHGPA